MKDVRKLLKLLIRKKNPYAHVRVGSKYDGGYIVPKLNNESVTGVVSIGIGGDISFDEYYAQRGVDVYQYDPSIENPPSSFFEDKFTFHKQAFGIYNNDLGCNFDQIIESNSLNYTGANLLAKFDIEGSEYGAILTSSSAALSKFSVLSGEFHMLNMVQDDGVYDMIYYSLSKLLETHFISHTHVNSNSHVSIIQGVVMPALLEITYLNKLYFKPEAEYNVSGLSELDETNVKDKPQIPWNPIWFSGEFGF